MKLKIIIVFLLGALISCGSSAGGTDIGNPTGDLYTVEGYIEVDGSTTITSKEMFEMDTRIENSIIVENLTVRAVDEYGVQYNTNVEPDGYFAINLPILHAYSMYVIGENDLEVGEFSFEQNDAGERANRLEVRSRGEVNMGRLRFTDREFEPEDDDHEPRRHGANEEDDEDEDEDEDEEEG